MGLTWTEPDVAARNVRQVLEATHNPFQVNFALAFPPHALHPVLDAGAPFVTFSWGDATPLVPKVHAAGARAGVQVVSHDGARRALDAGADFLICQGVEAGGHVQSTTSLELLLPLVVEEAGDVPVIGCGGLACGAHVARVLALGAAGAMLGTRFVATKESRAHSEYRRALVEAAPNATALTVCFGDGWPQSMHRVLRNSTFNAWEAAGSPPKGSRPGEGEVMANGPTGPVARYSDMAPREGMSGNIEAMCLYAGSGVDEIRDVPSAAELIERLWNECRIEESS